MWTWKQTVVMLIPIAFVVVGLIVWYMLRKTIRIRTRMEGQLRRDPDINEWLVVFGWSRKVLYTPAIIMSLIASGLMLAKEVNWLPGLNSHMLGGIWLA
ncbi:hypothetical protein LCGC14_1831120, partial [marine sediment metagenome]